MFWKQITVRDHERALVTKDGRFHAILAGGDYRMFVPSGFSLEIEKHNVRDLVFRSVWADYLVKHRPELTERFFHRVETNDMQVALVYVDGELYTVLTPAKRMLFWRESVDVTAELVEVISA